MGFGKLAIIWAFTLLGFWHLYMLFTHQESKMTWMYEKPEYHLIETESSNPYQLYFYGEGSYFNTEIAKNFGDSSAWPVLFVPGSGGSYKQGRSIGSVLYNKWKKAKGNDYFNTFTVDLNEELTGVYGATLDSQVVFLRTCLTKILSFYSSDVKITVVGHSMGGLVAKALANEFSHKINFLLTLGTPHAYPVISERPLNKFTNQYGRQNLKIPCVSISGGLRDFQVRPALSIEMDCLFVRGEAVPETWVSQDHQSLVWDNGLVLATARTIYDIRNSPDQVNNILKYHWVTKHERSPSFTLLDEKQIGSYLTVENDFGVLEEGAYEMTTGSDESELIVYGSKHYVKLNDDTLKPSLMPGFQFLTTGVVPPSSNIQISTEDPVKFNLVKERSKEDVPYILSWFISWIPFMTRQIEIKGVTVIDLDGFQMTYQVYNVVLDNPGLLIFRENTAVSMVARDTMTMSLTNGHNESNTDILVIPDDIDSHISATISVNMPAVFDVLMREYWPIMISFYVVQLCFVAASVIRGKQPTRIFWEVLSFVSKPYYICPLLSITHGAFNKTWLEWLVPPKDSKLAPDSEILDSRNLFHPIIYIICFIFAGVFLETAALLVFSILRILSFLFSRPINFLQKFIGNKYLIVGVAAIAMNFNATAALLPIIFASVIGLASQLHHRPIRDPKDEFWVDFIILLCLLTEFCLLLPSFIFWLQRGYEIHLPYDPAVIPSLIIIAQFPFDLASLNLHIPRKNFVLLLAVFAAMYCSVNLHRLVYIVPILLILIRSNTYPSGDSTEKSD